MINNYLFFQYSLSTRIMGNTGGIGQFIQSDHFLTRNTWYKELFKPGGDSCSIVEVTKVAQNIYELGLDPRAKLTDIMIGGIWFGKGLFVNEKAKHILTNEAHLPNHKFMKATFWQNNTIIDNYWWLAFDFDSGEHTMNFPACEFNFENISKFRDAPIKPIFNNYQDYLAFAQVEKVYPGMNKVVFNENFDRSLDIWSCIYTIFTFISVRLDKILKKNKIVGYRADNGNRWAPTIIFE